MWMCIHGLFPTFGIKGVRGIWGIWTTRKFTKGGAEVAKGGQGSEYIGCGFVNGVCTEFFIPLIFVFTNFLACLD